MSTPQDQSKLAAAKQAFLQKRLKGKADTPPQQKPITRQPDTGPVPLSFAQQRLWFLDQLEGGQNTSYHVPSIWSLQGRLHIAALEQSIGEIVRRHDVLRTTFPLGAEGQPVQVVAPQVGIHLPLEDLSAYPESERQAVADRRIVEEIWRPFDLATDVPSRVLLLRLGEREHILVWTVHHIATDGWSLGVMTRELVALYEAFSSGRPSPLPELPLQYADFSVWQREWLQGEVLEKQLAYWRGKLGGSLPVLQLPTDRPPQSRRTFHGKFHAFPLAADLSEALLSFCQREGVTLFMTMLAAFTTLLGRYAGTDDCVVGTPIAGRNRSELESMVGFFVNTLVMRTDLSGDPSFRELVQRVKGVALEAYSHQDVPFEKLVEALQPERDMSQSPLFRVLFSHANGSNAPLQLPDLTMRLLEFETQTAKFDLSLFVADERGQVDAWFEYNTDLFDLATMERMEKHLVTLLEAAMRRPEQRLSELPMLQPEEREQVLYTWNDTHAETDVHRCLHHLFEAQAAQTPERIAMQWGEEAMTYGELNARANRLARLLQAHGTGPNGLVGLCMERSFELLIAMLAIHKAGGALVPLDPSYPAERIAMILSESQAPLLLTETSLLTQVPHTSAAILCIDPLEIAEEAAENETHLQTDVRGEHLAYVLYTSGSTGKPKGVAMPHRAVVNNVTFQQKQDVVPGGARTLQFTSLNFDVSFQEIYSTFASGGTLVLISEEMRRDSYEMLHYLRAMSVERLFLPFVALQRLAEVAEESETVPETLRQVVTAGEQLQITRSVRYLFSHLPNCTLHNQYGPTETHCMTQYTMSGAPEEWVALPPIGRPIDNTMMYVLDAHLQPVPPGVPGELYLGGLCLADGYLHRPDLTAERFLPNPFVTTPGARMYKTGDLARFLPDGNVLYLGRIDKQVKVRGYRIELGEVEAVLGAHPQVREAAVTVREDELGDKRLVAYVALEKQAANGGLSASDLRQYLKLKLPDYMVPSAFVLLDALPLTPSGKIDRRSLPAPDAFDQQDAYVAPRDRFEWAMVAVWEQVLKRRPVGVTDNFFAIGGDSLKAVSLMSAIRKRFDVRLPLAALFQTPTPAELCVRLRADESGSGLAADSGDCLMQIQAGDPHTPPLFLIHPGWGGVLCYATLAGTLGEGQPVYGIQAVGYESDAAALTSIEEMAERYLAEILRVAPTGPYRLGGWSMGGTIAFELARRLEQRGAEVGCVLLLDAPFLGEQAEEAPVEWSDKKAVLQEFARLQMGNGEQPDWGTLDEAAIWQELLRHGKATHRLSADATVEPLQRELKLFVAHARANLSYKCTGPICSDLHLFPVTEVDATFPHPLVNEADWRPLTTGTLTVDLIAGHHLNLLHPPHVLSLGEKVKALLQTQARV